MNLLPKLTNHGHVLCFGIICHCFHQFHDSTASTRELDAKPWSRVVTFLFAVHTMAPPGRVNRAKTKARARVRVPVTTVNRDGINVPEMCTLNAKACTELAEQTNQEMLEHISGASDS